LIAVVGQRARLGVVQTRGLACLAAFPTELYQCSVEEVSLLTY
jgi:hypothetical protein